MIEISLLIPVFLLFGAVLLLSLRTALRNLSQSEIDEEFSKSKLNFSLFKKLDSLTTAPRQFKLSSLNDFLNLTALILLISYGASGIFTLEYHYIARIAILICCALVFHLIFQIFANQAIIATLKLFSLIGSFYLFIFLPITYPIIWSLRKLTPKGIDLTKSDSSEKLKQRLLDFLNEDEIQKLLTPMEQKLVSSIATFGDLVAREIMIPRPDMLCLPQNSTIYSALQMFIQEGYSRIPLYENTIDDITSVLLYKDVMEFCFKAIETDSFETIKSTSVKSLASDLLYSPENKKIQDLFHEMRIKKIHATIIVNEYGGTEGLVTIEDILEELVGSEIEDEHDEEEEVLYQETQDKSWIVDASMSIIDVEKKLGTKLPHGPEYETIAGFISLQAGCIPKPGTIIHGECFHLEVLKSDERQILEVKITPEKRETLDL